MLDHTPWACNFSVGFMGSRAAQKSVIALCALLCALLASDLAGGTASAGTEGGSFTAEEWRRLDAGETIVRPASRMQGDVRLLGGSSWQVIDAQPSAVWRALL